MNLAQPHPECSIDHLDDFVRAYVRPMARASEVEECYRSIATIVLERKLTRILIVGEGQEHARNHLAARDAIIAMDVIGVPAGFRLAFVPRSDATWNAYRHAELEARDRGLRVEVFKDEPQAIRWLTQPDLH